MLVVESIPVDSRLCDTDEVLTAQNAHDLKAAGFNGVIRYLDNLSSAEIANITGAGLGIAFVEYADEFNAAQTLSRAKALGLPAFSAIRCYVIADLESYTGDAATLIAKLNAWATAVQAAGYGAGLYVGPNQPLTAAQLGELLVDRYWRAASYGIPEPIDKGSPIGFVLHQYTPVDRTVAGVLIDGDFAHTDFRGRSLTWLISLNNAATRPELPAAAEAA